MIHVQNLINDNVYLSNYPCVYSQSHGSEGAENGVRIYSEISRYLTQLYTLFFFCIFSAFDLQLLLVARLALPVYVTGYMVRFKKCIKRKSIDDFMLLSSVRNGSYSQSPVYANQTEVLTDSVNPLHIHKNLVLLFSAQNV